ncbi:TetR/AcrR family transcriptional regulator [Actinosynnema sp. NPDC023587]|uniref:TetR/AcrR family transcriptional regulator n=1 Tax=Actinosynnema sp. NPDC023587 TaxID=3154695 RepID=UPI0033D251D9
MVRVSRAETQERTRSKVLAAARDEFAERGFRDAKVDAIAERVGLTRGAVYSNFPGKRALYFAVLADAAEHAYPPGPGSRADPGPDGGAFRHRRSDPGPGGGAYAHHLSTGSPVTLPPMGARVGLSAALGAFALAWVRPLAEDRLGRDLTPELLAEDVRLPYTHLLKLDALLLSLALERLRPTGPGPGGAPARRVRQAEIVLGALHGASRLAATAPGFLQPYDVVVACEHLADLHLEDWWSTPPPGPPIRPVEEPWTPPPAVDLVRGEPLRPRDGVVAVLGLNRLAAVEEAVRHGEPTTVVLATSEPRELGPLARLTVAQVCGPLRQAFPVEAWPDVRVVCDESGTFAKSLGVPAFSDETETALRVRNGRILVRADGFAACHAVAGSR